MTSSNILKEIFWLTGETLLEPNRKYTGIEFDHMHINNLSPTFDI